MQVSINHQKVERAKELQIELKKCIKSFFDGQPYTVATKRDSTNRKLIYYLSKADEVPFRMSLLVGDLIQNLRSALDHAVFANYKKNNSGPGRHIYFPIGISLADLNEKKNRQTKGVSEEALKLIDEIRPYKDANQVLWILHELNIADKHRALVIVITQFHGVDLGQHIKQQMQSRDLDFPDIPFFFTAADPEFPARVGTELFIDGPDAQEISSMRFMFELGLYEPAIVGKCSVTDLTESMIDEVEKILGQFEKLP